MMTSTITPLVGMPMHLDVADFFEDSQLNDGH